MIPAINWQRAEGGLVLLCGLAIHLHQAEALPWWAALLIFFAPDLSIVGYAWGARVGAFLYNAVHIYAFGAAFLALGLVAATPILVTVGALCMAHAGFDRLLGYGLKSPEGFSFTHLGRIGKAGQRRPPQA
ncbi:DUF4260 domain-containing protein [Roseococcus thiosulfatophilus]|uniref:DUF4260 domain-containing protein n=1 Tax=Roseococcus thiosulfatophilus TaxID=35813 RepID=UPI001A8E3F9B|nr:DUF4260 domain-containing protein [Roseococcus thiosulfatophilus]